MINILTPRFNYILSRREEESTRSKVYFTQHLTDPSCSPAHLPSQPASPGSGSPFPGPATQPPPTHHSAQTPALDAPPRDFERPKPGPFGHGEP